MLTRAEIEKIKNTLNDLSEDVEIIVVPNENWKDFENFAKILSKLCDRISYRVEDRGGLIAKPAMILKKDEQENIIYNAIPLRDELEPFLRTIIKLSNGFEIEDVKGFEAEIVVFVMPVCPYCAKVVEIVNSFAVANPKIKSIVVDVSRFVDLMYKYDISSAPTTMINGEIKLIGYVSKDQLLEWLKRVSGDYKKDYFVTLLNERRLDEIKEIIAKNPKDIRILAELLAYEDFMIRFGAMVVLEQIHRENPDVIKLAKDVIRNHLKHEDFRIREDVAMLLGSIGDETDVKFLEELLKEDEEEVKASAIEAIKEIRDKYGK